MKQIIVFILSVVLVSNIAVFGQENNIKTANDLYASGKFEDAAKMYEQLIQNEGISPEIYYNLGNAYYKLNETGLSILNYERALRLKPNYSDALNNLQFAQAKVVDNVVAIPPFFLVRWLDLLIKVMNSNQWFFVSVLVFILGLLAVMFFIYGSSHYVRKTSFYVAVILVSMAAVSLLFAGIRKADLTTHNNAIIMAGSVTIKSSPDKSGTDLFQLHEGTKVSIKSKLGDWSEIELGNGNIGWVKSSNIEEI